MHHHQKYGVLLAYSPILSGVESEKKIQVTFIPVLFW